MTTGKSSLRTLRLAALTAAMAVTSLATPLAQAQDAPVGRVLSAAPLVQQVAMPHQVCTPERYVSRESSTGAGAVVGAIAGGLLGSAVGRGPGRGMATVVGAATGALVGDSVEDRNRTTTVQDSTRCYDQTAYEQRTVGYKVVYEYGGRQYQTQLAHDPGAYVALRLMPDGQVTAADVIAWPADSTVVTAAPAVTSTTYYVESPPPAVVYVASPPPPHRPPYWGPGW